jgi:DNA-binding transcriptional regulator YhcF (GntR family)
VIDDSDGRIAREWPKEVAALWEDENYAPIAIYSCPTIDKNHWLLQYPMVTTIANTRWNTNRNHLEHVTPRTEKGVSSRDTAADIASFIETIDVQKILETDSAPLYDRIIRLLLAICQVLDNKQSNDLANNAGKGIRLPSEGTLAKLLHVSRVTSRRALEDLKSAGLVVRDRGGSYLTAQFRFFLDNGTARGSRRFDLDTDDTEQVNRLYLANKRTWLDYENRSNRRGVDLMIADPPHVMSDLPDTARQWDEIAEILQDGFNGLHEYVLAQSKEIENLDRQLLALRS